MQRSLYGNLELAYEGSTLTVRSVRSHQFKMIAMFGFWLYVGGSLIYGGVLRHQVGWIVAGAVVALFNGLMLLVQLAATSSGVKFDRSTQTFHRGSRTRPFSEAPRIEMRPQSGTYLITLVVNGGPNLDLNFIAPLKQEAEARRAAGEISEFTGIPLNAVSTPAPTPTAPPSTPA